MKMGKNNLCPSRTNIFVSLRGLPILDSVGTGRYLSNTFGEYIGRYLGTVPYLPT